MITAPPVNTRPTSYHLGDTHASGINALTQPERLAPGMAQDIVNLFWDGDSLTTRPGIVGQLTSALAGPIYMDRVRYVTAASVVRIPFASSGKLYYFQEGASAAVEITKPGPASFALSNNGQDVRFAVLGRWLYILDAGDSAFGLWRVNLSSTTVAQSAAGITASTIAPIATGGFRSLLLASAGTWYPDTCAATALVASDANSVFTTGDASGTNVGTLWGIVSGTPKVYANAAVSGLPANVTPKGGGSVAANWLRLDDPGDTIVLQSTGPLNYSANDAITNANAWTGGGNARYACHWNLSFWAIALGTGYKNIYAKALYYSDTAATTPLGEETITIYLSNPGNATFLDYVLSHPEFPLPVRAVQLIFHPDQSSTVSTNTHYVSGVKFNAVGGSAVADSPSAGNISAGIDAKLQGALAQNMVSFVFTATQDWSAVAVAGIPFTSNAILPDDLPMRIRLRIGTTGANAITANQYWMSPVFSDFASVALDLTQVPAAVRSSVKVLDIVFEKDIRIQGLPSGRVPSASRIFLTTVGISDPGNLSIGLNYAYLWSEANGVDPTADGYIEGSSSPFSGFVKATTSMARVVLDLKGIPASAPSLDSQAASIAIYKIGAAVADGDTRAHVVARVPLASDLAYPVGTTKDQATNQWYWDHTNFLFYDNVPDSALAYANVYQQGRDLAPVGGNCLIDHAGRLWIGRYDTVRRVNEIYASWAVDGINDFPYFTNAPDDDDPESATKGTKLRVGGQGTGDRIVAFGKANLETQGGNIGGSLMVMRQSTPPSIIHGWRGGVIASGAFRLWPSPVERGGGCLSAQGIEMVNGRTLYLAATGIVSTMGSQLDPQSRTIEKRLKLSNLGKARYTRVFLAWHDSRLWVIIPGTGSTDGEALVWDERPGQGGWIRASMAAGFTSAVSLSGGEDVGDLYFGGRDGQVYKMAGSVDAPAATSDKALPSSSATAIAWSFISRRHGQVEAEGIVRYGINRPNALLLDVYYNGAGGTTTTLAWRITNEFGHTAGEGADQIIPAGRIVRTEISGVEDVRGMVHDVTLSGGVVKTLTLHSYLMLATSVGPVR